MSVNWEEECRSLRIDIRELRALSVGQQAEIERLLAALEQIAALGIGYGRKSADIARKALSKADAITGDA